MLPIEITRERVFVGQRFSVSFQRTLCIPDAQLPSAPPTSLGALPVHHVAEFAGLIPDHWERERGVFIPALGKEALWLGFSGAAWKPNAVQVLVDDINAISGDLRAERLHDSPQDYLVCPPQISLDGIYAGSGLCQQFVPALSAHTLDQGLWMHIIAYEPRPGRFRNEPPAKREMGPEVTHAPPDEQSAGKLGLRIGGRIEQKILPDPFGSETWDPSEHGSLFIYIVSELEYQRITGREPPGPRDLSEAYTKFRLP